jgi:hypothetical protein
VNLHEPRSLNKDEVPLTHEYRALMFDVWRTKATVGLQILEGEHMIKETHGPIRVLDRAKLEKRAGE